MTEILPTYVWADLDRAQQLKIVERPPVSMANRDHVQLVIDQVKADGDAGVFALTNRFDGIKVPDSRVPVELIREALDKLDAASRDALCSAYQNIKQFHEAQRFNIPAVNNTQGVTCEVLARPIEAVGLYVPGGTAPLPSTVLMLGVPSQLANCPTRVLCTPPQKDGQIDPLILAAAALCDIDVIHMIGGAQAVAAMAYGTESVPKVNKIFGPGNPWVTAAKQMVALDPHGAGFDLPAGPSEVLVIADSKANTSFVAADLLAQAEHGSDSQVILVTTSSTQANAIRDEVSLQLAGLTRQDIATSALRASRAIVARDIDEAFEISNTYAPEHLIINTQSSREDLARVNNAGSVFLGEWTPESLGDYCSGTNHVLPTHGYASHVSGIGLGDFQKRITVQEATREGLNSIGWIAETIAMAEGLDAHAKAVSVRTNSAGFQTS